MAVAVLSMEKSLASGSLPCRGGVAETAEARLGNSPRVSCKVGFRKSYCAGLSRQDISEIESASIRHELPVSIPGRAENSDEKEKVHGPAWTKVLKSSLVSTSLAVSLLVHPLPETSTDSLQAHKPLDVAIESLSIGLGMVPITVRGADEVIFQDVHKQVNWADWEPQAELQQDIPLWLGGSLGWKVQEADRQPYNLVPKQESLRTQTAFYMFPVDEDEDDEDELSLDAFPEGLGYCPMWQSSRLETTVPLGPVTKALPPGLKWPASFEVDQDLAAGEESAPSPSQVAPELKGNNMRRLGALRVGIDEVTPVWEVLVGGCFSL